MGDLGLITASVMKVVGTFVTVGAICLIIVRAHAQLTNFSVLRVFGGEPQAGYGPEGGVIKGTDGAFYGATTYGGTEDRGVVFRADTNGGYTVLHHFRNADRAGEYPTAPLIEGEDGFLYGTAPNGGTNFGGTLFRVRKDGTEFRAVWHFGGASTNGTRPSGPLAQGADGALYGVAQMGGSNDLGTVYRISTEHGEYTILHTFNQSLLQGKNPAGGVLLGSDGWLYGTAQAGGTNNLGTVFRVSTNGGDYTVLYHFTGVNGDGATPLGGLIEATDGAIYGTTQNGGVSGNGTVFRLDKDGTRSRGQIS